MISEMTFGGAAIHVVTSGITGDSLLNEVS